MTTAYAFNLQWHCDRCHNQMMHDWDYDKPRLSTIRCIDSRCTEYQKRYAMPLIERELEPPRLL